MGYQGSIMKISMAPLKTCNKRTFRTNTPRQEDNTEEMADSC